MVQNGFGEVKAPFELYLDVIWKSESEYQQTRKKPSPLTTSWSVWVFFRRLFKENTYLGNKRSTYIDQLIRKLSLRAATKNISMFFYTTHTFFYIFTFMFRYRNRPFRKFNVQLCSRTYWTPLTQSKNRTNVILQELVWG